MQWELDLSAPAAAAPPVLDEDQRAVVAHRRGPLLVLAGPGTGKTTTIVESIVARLTDPADPLDPRSVLALTFGRRAALDLRDRVSARLGGGILPAVATFHSFAYGLVRLTEPASTDPPRLMSGAEDDVRIRTLLQGAVQDATISWPDDLMAALPTIGLANEVRAVLARARDLGMDAEDLRAAGRRDGRPAWVAIGELAPQVRDVMLLENVMDYGELLWRAVLRAREPDVRALLHRTYRAVFVDEYQDTDPLQVELLRELVGPECALVAVGDPDQAIYAFRGADVTGLEQFTTTFPAGPAQPAPVIVLRHCRRFGPAVRAAAAAVIGRNGPVPGVSATQSREHRHPMCIGSGPDDVRIDGYDDPSALAAWVADDIRATHLGPSPVPWGRMAVLVRGGAQIPAMQRALRAAGVPVRVAVDEIPLRREPAVAVLLLAVRLALAPEHATTADVTDLLSGPLAGLSGSDLRRLGRDLRAVDLEPGVAAPMSTELIRAALTTGVPLPDTAEGRSVQRLRDVLAQVRAAVPEGPHAAVWAAWTGGRSPHGWPERLRAAALAGSWSAGHDLDAVSGLMDAAARFTAARTGVAAVRSFLASLEAQEIPAEAVQDRGTADDCVRILTAHRAKGLEWDQVWVVGAQEGVWPDLRQRGSTLRAEQLGATGAVPGPTVATLLAEERRLFYVACTRARQRVRIAVVREQRDDGEQPSRFVDDLRAAGVPMSERRGRPAHPLTLAGLVARLRAIVEDPQQPIDRRTAAVQRLAVLAGLRDATGQPLVPAADPARWWGVREPTSGPRPVRDPQAPLHLSGSGLDSILDCPLHWFLDREVRAETPRGTATAFGSIVHAVADFVAKDEIPPDLGAMVAEVDRIWPAVAFEAGWQSVAEKREARDALARFLAYHLAQDRALVATEAAVRTELEVPLPDGGTDRIALSGFIDRVERADDGGLVAIDLKNMRTPVPAAEVPDHGQLGVYQLVLREAGVGDGPSPVAGAALVQLRVPAGKDSPMPKIQEQGSIGADRPSWVEQRLGAAAAVVRGEEFPAIPGGHCRYCAFTRICPTTTDGGQVAP